MKKVQVVSLAQPCTACVITCGLVKEILEKLRKTHLNFELELVELEHIRDAASVEGLEVETFPAIIIDGEQVTAGSLPDRNMLKAYINGAGETHE